MEKKTNKTEKADRKHPAFKKNAEPFYQIIMEGLKGEVDGGHFWDAVAENAVFEFLYNFAGFPNKLEGRKTYMDWLAGTVIFFILPTIYMYTNLQTLTMLSFLNTKYMVKFPQRGKHMTTVFVLS
jgi:hypothetical protein